MKVELDRGFWHKMADLYKEGLIHDQYLSCIYECGADILNELVSYFPQDLNDMWDKITYKVSRHKYEYDYDLHAEIDKILDKWGIE